MVPFLLAATLAIPALPLPRLSPPPPLDPAAASSAWSGAAAVTMGWDVQHQRPASERTVARIATDGAFLYVRFEAEQREAIVAQQRTNEVGGGTDDQVWVDLWPDSNRGFQYTFTATPLGVHYQSSTENTAYSPTWTSLGRTVDGGYVTTMKIPLRVLRSQAGAARWKVQFVRLVRSTGERQIWSYDPAQTNGDDVSYAGSLTGVPSVAAARPQPRIGFYGLAAGGPPTSGLSTSRTGADLSIPITATSSFYGTLHPDFSNVEIDQQTISPTAYQRSFTEVRPFFTQGASFYGAFGCVACPQIQELYTPGIPTPRDGYAVEGKQGPVSFAAFDAVGAGRTDGAATVQYRPSVHWSFIAQDVGANLPGVVDRTQTYGVNFNDRRHFQSYFTYGTDAGTNVLDGRQAQRYDGGAYYYTPVFGIGGSARKVGAFYEPVDGFVQHADIAGYSVFTNRLWHWDASVLNSMQIGGNIDRYHGSDGRLNQSDSTVWLDVLSRNLIDAQVILGSSFLRLPSGVFSPVNQAGASVTWHSGSANDVGNNLQHGPSATPTTVQWYTGRFGPGTLDTWLRSTTMRAGMRGTVSLEIDDTRQFMDSGFGPTNVEWLQRLGYTYATGPSSSLAVGIRHIIGTPPLLDAAQPPGFTRAWNLSFAFHRRLSHDELYFAYGDASQLSTVPQVILKLIHYVGAEKGT